MSFLFSVTTTKSLKIFNLVLLCIRSRNRWIVFSITKTSKNLSRVKSFQKRSKFKNQRATSGSFVNVNWSCWSSGRTRANCIRVTTSASSRVTYSPPQPLPLPSNSTRSRSFSSLSSPSLRIPFFDRQKCNRRRRNLIIWTRISPVWHIHNF